MSLQTVLRKLRDMENAVRAVLRESGFKVGSPGRELFAARVRELAEADPTLIDITDANRSPPDKAGSVVPMGTKGKTISLRVQNPGDSLGGREAD